MSLTKTQLIIFGGAILVILIFGLIFAGILPGSKNTTTNPASVQGTLTAWLYGDDLSYYTSIVAAYNATFPNVKINLRQFTDYNAYTNALLEAMAAGQSPDIFMIPSTELPNYLNKIIPLSPTQFSLLNLQQDFPQVVSQDFVSGSSVYGLPLSIDTLALFYNKDLFAKAGIVYPPSTWQGFDAMIPKLTEISSTGTITQAAAAVGTSDANIDNATGILSLLMLQNGTQITDKTKNAATFDSSSGLAAVSFYTQFSNPGSAYYTWNYNMSDSIDAFAENKVAMIFDYESAENNLKAKNSFLNYGIAPVPQPASSTIFVSSPQYLGFTVSKQSRVAGLAWNFVQFMTTNPGAADLYVKASGNPPALLSLINNYLNDPNLSVFAKQALYARSWYGPERSSINPVFSQMIDSLVTGQGNSYSALKQAQDQITGIMNSGGGF